MTEWKTIDSAPKDGTVVLLGNPNWLYAYRGWWDEDAHFGSDMPNHPGWQTFYCDQDDWHSSAIEPYEVTHWMPLPALPAPPEEVT